MKIKIFKASDDEFEEEVEIATLEDLKGLQEQYKHRLIVNFGADTAVVTVYDDYVE